MSTSSCWWSTCQFWYPASSLLLAYSWWVYKIQVGHLNLIFQTLRIMFWPWLVSTVLATAVEAVIDGWIMSRVQQTGYNITSVSTHFSTGKLCARDCFSFHPWVLLPHASGIDCAIVNPSQCCSSVQVYTVVCTVQLYTHVGHVDDDDGLFTKVCRRQVIL